ncbi:MAG: glycosyltransferase family 39 protein [Bacteroidia bacterium]|nr:glycosyltransferase family 39 protein [Bacteroidia bacterium]
MTRLTYINTDKYRRTYSGNWRRTVDARLRASAPWMIAFAALWRFPGLALGEMQQWDEAIYALRVQVILRFGEVWDQSVNMLAGSYYSAHPPLYVWFSTFWSLLLGEAVWTHRLTSALAGAGLVLLTYRIGRRMVPRTLATLAALFVGFAPLLVRYSRLGQLDALLALLMLAALWAGIVYVREERKRHLLAGALFLGAALMTKMLFALSVPAGIFCAGLLLNGAERRRALTFAITATALSLPLWLPWLLSFSLRHGDGNLLYIFSSAVPLGATLGGQEGTMKETGLLYYFNQLSVHVSAILPFALFAMYRTLRSRRSVGFLVLVVWFVLQFTALLATGSSFEVYLLPMFAPLALFAMRGVQLARRTALPVRKFLLTTSALCFVWSLSLDWRIAVKSVIGIASSAGVTGDTLLIALIFTVVTLCAVILALICAANIPAASLFSSSSLWALVVVIFAVSAYRYYHAEPKNMLDGADAVSGFIRESQPTALALIGNGENPQLTWYLDGADIGWHTDAPRTERLEPRHRGIEAVQSRLHALAERYSLLAVVELDDGVHDAHREPGDVLPRDFRIVLRTQGYLVARSTGASPAKEAR